MTQPRRPLLKVLAQLPDPRLARGQRYPLVAVLALAWAAMLCGYRSYRASAEWGDNDGAALLQAVGFVRARAPCAAPLHLIFHRLDRTAGAAALGRGAVLRRAQTVNRAHGRTQRRPLGTRALVPGDSAWPGARQIVRIERRRSPQKTGLIATETTDGITRLRRHWHSDNKAPWVRDVTFAEDRSQVRIDAIPQVMAALRSPALGLLRTTGVTNIAAATRYYAAQPREALFLLGLPPTTN